MKTKKYNTKSVVDVFSRWSDEVNNKRIRICKDIPLYHGLPPSAAGRYGYILDVVYIPVLNIEIYVIKMDDWKKTFNVFRESFVYVSR